LQNYCMIKITLSCKILQFDWPVPSTRRTIYIIIKFCTRFPYHVIVHICMNRCWYVTDLLQHDFNEEKAIYVTDVIDFFKHSSGKFCKS
jgi:hypothetical protein